MDVLEKFKQKKEDVKTAEGLFNSIEVLKKKVLHTEKLVKILQNSHNRDSKEKCMLMLGIDTPETGRINLDIDKSIYNGLIIGLTETIRMYNDELVSLNLLFDTIVNKN